MQKAMDNFAKQTGRAYKLYEYHGAPDAERVVIAMGSGCEAIHETVDFLLNRGEKVGVLKVRLFRPFENKLLLAALPKTVKAIAVLDRTKEPGSAGEPLYLDVVQAVFESISEPPRARSPPRTAATSPSCPWSWADVTVCPRRNSRRRWRRACLIIWRRLTPRITSPWASRMTCLA